MTAQQIAELVRSGERSARSVLDEHLEFIRAREPEINAFNLVTIAEARATAEEIDRQVEAGEDPGLLAGVPVALKDNLCTRGVPTTCSSKMLEGWRPPYDATVVGQLRDAGAVIVGKTNMDEFAMGSSTETSAFGPTRNPHNLECVPGGSSGGSAAAVAAGLVPLALGTDTGGSIRQPAALCGVVGIKPTYGLVSRYGAVAFASSLDQIGPFATTVSDAALLLDVIAKYDPADSTSIPDDRRQPGLIEAVTGGVEGLRVGVISELTGEGIAADVASRMAAAIKSLEAAGAKVDSVQIPSIRHGLSAYYLIAASEASSNLARFDGVRHGLREDASTVAEMMTASRTAGFGPEVKRRIMLGTYALSAGYYDACYGNALKVRTLLIRDFEAAYGQFDVLVSPTSPTTAFRLGEIVDDPLQMYLNDVCTNAANLAGHPAISVPFGVGDDGLPVGIQVMAPTLGEAKMLRAAAVLESSLLESSAPESVGVETQLGAN